MSLSSRAFLSLNLKKRETACSLEIQAKTFSVTETKASCNTLKLQFPRYLQWTWSATQPFLVSVVVNLYTYFEKGCRKKKCTLQSRKVIWDMINTLFLTTVAVEPTFVAFL